MSTVTEIADAVVEELNRGGFALAFEAQRCYQPLFELQDLRQLHVTVVPNGIARRVATRGRVQTDYKVDVAVQQKLGAEGEAEADPLMALVEAIINRFEYRRLASLPRAIWVHTANEPVFAQEHLERLRQFTSVITFTFRVYA